MTSVKLTKKDIFFAGVNGSVFGLLLPVVMKSFNVSNQPPYLLMVAFFTILAIIGVLVGYILAKKIKPFFFQLTKFGATGAANFAVDIGILALLVIIFYPHGDIPTVSFAIFKTISFISATVNSYIWNKYWSFQDKESSDILQEFGKFVLVSVIGLILNVIVATIVKTLNKFTGLDPKTWAAISAMVASVAVLTWNFVGYKFLVFKK